MRWLVEVSSLGKTDLQKFCVEAESWQRALQAARAQRGEEGPMSGFSIELLEEGYRAVDPLARVRFVVKRAPDDMPITTSAPPVKDTTKKSIPPSPAAGPPAAASSSQKTAPASDKTDPKMTPPPAPSSSQNVSASGKNKKASPSAPRPGGSVPPPANTATGTGAQTPEAKKKAQTMVFASGGSAEVHDEKPKEVVERAPLLAVGSQIPGLPAVKLLTSREQEPNEQSPLTYREYAFAVPDGTTDDVGADVLRAQLRLVEAHIADAKKGRLVNLAVFDVEFKGKPPKPPLATLTWKDWKGDPVVAFPRRGGGSKQPKPPEKKGSGEVPKAQAPVSQNAPVSHQAPPASAMQAKDPVPPAPQTQPLPTSQPASFPPPALQLAPPPSASPASIQPQWAQQQASVAPVEPPAAPPPQPHLAPAVAAIAAHPPQAPVMTESQKMAAQQGMVKTPSGRFVRGRVTGDELITALFESMHDLHFLRDALDGGQFCLALATEVLPSRAAIIHFHDVERQEWVIACTRGKDAGRLLNMRTSGDDMLRNAAKRRRAVVIPNANDAQAERYRQLGGARSLIIAPIMQAGRALGCIEIMNPLDGMPFNEDEGNAMQYIAEQYAEYLGSRGIVLDRERIQSAAAAR